ncbi:MAG: LptF/LptG family permease [Bacteroidia bacterium]|nr:LptF/LptG family permease [Bacteroidia bacterium]
MKRLYLLILKSYIGPLILTFFISLFILLMQFLWKYIDELVGKGLDWKVIAELMLYASASLVPMALPLSILLSSLMTFGNLGENYELIALKSAGISLPRIFKPLIILTFVISIGAFYFSNYVLPFTNLKMGSLLFDVRQKQPEISISEGVFYNGIDNYSIKVEKKDKKKKMLYGIMIYDHTQHNGNTSVIVADSGKMSITADQMFLILKLYHGNGYLEMPESRSNSRIKTFPLRRDVFGEEQILFKLAGAELNRTDEGLFKKHYQMLNLKQLTYAEDSLKKDYDQRKVYISKSLLAYNYFKADPRKKIIDTIHIAEKKFAPSQFDSVFNKLAVNDRHRSCQMALSFARSTKSYLSSSEEDLSNRDKWIKRHQIEWHRKFSLSFACFVLFFIGAPFGAIIRKGGFGMPMVISVIFFILYYMISISGEKFVRESMWPPFAGMWISSFILLPAGVFLTYKASTDSALMNIDTLFESVKEFVEKSIKKLPRRKKR